MSTKLPQIQPTSSKVIVGNNDKKAPVRLFKKRSVSEVEDPISQLKKNLFSKLEKYDKDENENLNKSYGLIENSQQLQGRKSSDRRSLNASFNIEQQQQPSNGINLSIKRNSITKTNSRHLLEDDDMTDEQFLSDLYGANGATDSINLNKGKSENRLLLGSSITQNKTINNPSQKLRNQHNISFSGSSTIDKQNRSKQELNSSFSSFQQENNLNEDKPSTKQIHQKTPFLTNILDQIDQNSNVIRSKNNFNKLSINQNTITPKKAIINDSKTMNVNYQINNNITNMQALNSFSDKKDNNVSDKIAISNKLNNHTQAINITKQNPQNLNLNTAQYSQQADKSTKEKKIMFLTPFQSEVLKKEQQSKQEAKISENRGQSIGNMPSATTTINEQPINKKKSLQKNKHPKSKQKEIKDLPEYNENYTGIESFDESEDSQDDGQADDEENKQILDDYNDYYESNYIEEEGQQLSTQIINIKKECQELDNDLFSLKDLLTGMRGDWKEYEELGAEFTGIDSFIKEVDTFQKEKDLLKQQSFKYI